MQKTGIGWLAWDLTHSAAWVGTIALADLVAALWVGPLAGAVTDRSNPFRLLITTQGIALILAAGLWGTTAAGLIDIWVLLFFAIGEASIQGFNQPVRMTVTGQLAGPARLSQAIATNSIAVNLARAIGPAIAGWIMLKGSVEWVFAANALSFVAMLGAVMVVRRWIDADVPGSKAALAGDITDGFRYIAQTPKIATLFSLVLSFSLLARPFSELLPAFAGQVFAGGPQTLSALMSAQGCGALFGAAWMLRRRPADVIVRTTLATSLGLTLSLLAFTATRRIELAVAAMILTGLCHVVSNIGMQSLAQLFSDPALRGRVLALYSLLFRSGPSLGAFAIGLASHWLGLQLLVGAAALLHGLVLLSALPVARRVYARRPLLASPTAPG